MHFTDDGYSGGSFERLTQEELEELKKLRKKREKKRKYNYRYMKKLKEAGR